MISTIKSLLVADDDIDDLLLLLSAINTFSKDIDVSHVKDGAELLAFLLSEKKPGLILLDINMPKINGMDCLKRIRSNEYLDEIPIIMYSTSSNKDVIENCYQFGASRYIVKPFKYDDIVKFMRKILSFDWSRSKVVSKETFLIVAN